MTREVKFAAVWAAVCAAVGFAAFATNFWIVHGPYPGYRIMLYPGILATGLFSEEINFWPKLAIMLFGQFLICFVSLLVARKMYSASVIYRNRSSQR